MSTRHVRPDDSDRGGWVVATAESGSVEYRTTTQGEAVEQARNALLAQGGGTMVVHGVDGSVREERSVG